MSKPDKILPNKVIGFSLEKTVYYLDVKKALLYNVSVGYSKNPLDKNELAFTYELSDQFKVNPTIVTTQLEIDFMFQALTECPGIPEFNPMMLLHGEQKIVLNISLNIDTKYFIKTSIVDCQDKKKGALIVFQSQTFSDEQCSNLVHESFMSVFIRGIGNFSNSKQNYKQWIQIPKKPKNNFDFEASQQTDENQALLYRINGDLNPLHVDPDMAQMGGFKKPILHGLCTYGISNKILMQKLCNNDVDQFKSLSGRFTSHVFPGETLIVSAQKISKNQYYFETKTKERGFVVLMGMFETKGEPMLKL